MTRPRRRRGSRDSSKACAATARRQPGSPPSRGALARISATPRRRVLGRAAAGDDDRARPASAVARIACGQRAGRVRRPARRARIRPARAGSAAIMSVMWYGGPSRQARRSGRTPTGRAGRGAGPADRTVGGRHRLRRIGAARRRVGGSRHAPRRNRLRTRHHGAAITSGSTDGGSDAGRVDGAAGVEGRVRRLAAGRRLGSHRRARRAGRGARLRVALGVRSLPHRAAPDRGDHVRVVLGAVGARDGHRARPPGAHGRVHRVPQSGADGQDVVDDRRHQRRPVRARDRRRLEGRGVARLRLRLPDARRADGRVRRPPRGHPRDVRAGPRELRGRVRPRPRRDTTSRRASRSRASRSSSAATASG